MIKVDRIGLLTGYQNQSKEVSTKLAYKYSDGNAEKLTEKDDIRDRIIKNIWKTYFIQKKINYHGRSNSKASVNLLLRNKFNAIAHSSRPLLRSTLADSDLKIKKKKKYTEFLQFLLVASYHRECVGMYTLETKRLDF